MNNISSIDKEVEILKNIASCKDVRQRDLSKILGLSLGMINSILKRLVKKGFLKIQKINNRTMHYIVSPVGMKAIAQRSYSFFKRTINNVIIYKEIIEELIDGIKAVGYNQVVLVGNSDVDFIIEHLCIKKDIQFKKEIPIDDRNTIFYFYGEDIEPGDNYIQENPNMIYLSKVLL